MNDKIDLLLTTTKDHKKFWLIGEKYVEMGYF